jgi:hypothetical protein
MAYSFYHDVLGTVDGVSQHASCSRNGGKTAKHQYSGCHAATQGFLSTMQITKRYDRTQIGMRHTFGCRITMSR